MNESPVFALLAEMESISSSAKHRAWWKDPQVRQYALLEISLPDGKSQLYQLQAKGNPQHYLSPNEARAFLLRQLESLLLKELRTDDNLSAQEGKVIAERAFSCLSKVEREVLCYGFPAGSTRFWRLDSVDDSAEIVAEPPVSGPVERTNSNGFPHTGSQVELSFIPEAHARDPKCMQWKAHQPHGKVTLTFIAHPSCDSVIELGTRYRCEVQRELFKNDQHRGYEVTVALDFTNGDAA